MGKKSNTKWGDTIQGKTLLEVLALQGQNHITKCTK